MFSLPRGVLSPEQVPAASSDILLSDFLHLFWNPSRIPDKVLPTVVLLPVQILLSRRYVHHGIQPQSAFSHIPSVLQAPGSAAHRFLLPSEIPSFLRPSQMGIHYQVVRSPEWYLLPSSVKILLFRFFPLLHGKPHEVFHLLYRSHRY